MRSAIVRHSITALIATGLLVGLAGTGRAQFILYDDFSSGAIGPGRWSGFSTEGPFNAPTAESFRLVENGSLRLGLVSWGDNTSDSGVVLSRNGLDVRQLGTPGGSGSIIGLKAKVTVVHAEAQDCTTNPAVTSTRAQLIGSFFNDGSGGVGNRTGDIIVPFVLEKDEDGMNRIVGSVNRCPDNACASSVPISLAGNPVTFGAGWNLGAAMILKVLWDSGSGQFLFSATDPATLSQESHAVIYQGSVTNAGPPAVDFKSVRILNVTENCSTGRKGAAMDVLFDNIKVMRQP